MNKNGYAFSTKVVIFLLGVLFVLCSAEGVFSQEYPTKTVTMVCGMDPGGVVDVATRILADNTKKIFGQDILVENKPGASHMVAASYVVNSKPDGYTLFPSTDAPFVRVPHMMNLKFDPISETTPIIFFGIFTHFIVVSADSPFKTLKDMLIYAKQNPDKLTFGNPGHGTVPHLTMAGMALETGLKFSHIPFAGENKEIAALLGGHLMAAGIAIESCISQVQAGKLRALAVLQGDNRLSAFPDIPTLKEVAKDFGMKSSVIYPGLMISGPKGLPDPIVKKLVTAFDAGRKTPGFQKYATEGYIFQDNMPVTGQALKDHLVKAFKETGALIQALEIKKK
jgi:tripartite-type tricarboxylate transporter receptor subunit TctC